MFKTIASVIRKKLASWRQATLWHANRSAEYRRAFGKWKKLHPIEGVDTAGRLSRDQVHARC